MNVILAVQILAALGMIGLILVQHGKGPTWVLRSVAARPAACLVPAEAPTSFPVLPPCWRRCFHHDAGAGLLGNSRPASSGSVLETPAAVIPASGSAADAECLLPCRSSFWCCPDSIK